MMKLVIFSIASFMIGSFSMSAAVAEQIVTVASPPPVGKVAVYSCKIIDNSNSSYDAEVRVDYAKNSWAPWVSIKSTQEVLLSSMPSTRSIAKPDSLDRKVSFKISSGNWQNMTFQIISSDETVTSISFYREKLDVPAEGEVVNSLFAVGICKIALEVPTK
jgi:hypothetical protein